MSYEQPSPVLYPYLVTPPPVPHRRKWPVILAVAVVLGVGVVGVGGAAAVNDFAKRNICGSLAKINDDKPSSADQSDSSDPDPAQLRKDLNDMRTMARLLVFDGKLRTAVLAVADDVERAATMEQQAKDAGPDQAMNMLPALIALAGQIDLHVRDAQEACGQKPTGIMKN